MKYPLRNLMKCSSRSDLETAANRAYMQLTGLLYVEGLESKIKLIPVSFKKTKRYAKRKI